MKTLLSYSLEQDPYVNLAHEYELLERAKRKKESHLFLYRNRPCLVLGRFQNPWREIDFGEKPEHVAFVRRHSGGGTVYHDLGNWNFSFIGPGDHIDEKKHLDVIRQALATFSLAIEMNERFDLLFEGRKISGSAFRRVKGAHLHHGTLLVDAKLSDLKSCLGKNASLSIEGKGVKSVPSPVVNIFEHAKDLSWERLLAALEKSLQHQATPWRRTEMSALEQEHHRLLTSWEWLWGQGPKAEITFSDSSHPVAQVILSLDKGFIEGVHIHHPLLTTDEKDLLHSLLLLKRVRTEPLALNSLGSDNSVKNNLLIFLNQHFFNDLTIGH